MDDLSKFILEKLGVSGAFIIALAAYLVKKELSFQKERTDMLAIIENKSKDMMVLFEKSISSNFALEKEIHALRIELLERPNTK